jgi:hypothetical protein
VSHAPAPWSVRGSAIMSANGDLIAQVYDEHVDAEANARLIAESPNMLERLHATRSQLHETRRWLTMALSNLLDDIDASDAVIARIEAA